MKKYIYLVTEDYDDPNYGSPTLTTYLCSFINEEDAKNYRDTKQEKKFQKLLEDYDGDRDFADTAMESYSYNIIKIRLKEKS